MTITLATAFVAAMVLGATLLRGTAAADADTQLLGADLVATTTGSAAEAGAPEIEGAEEVWPILDASFVSVHAEDGERARSLRVYTPPPSDVADLPIVQGRVAESADEIVIEQSAAELLDVEMGDTILVARPHQGSSGEGGALEVVGITGPLDSALLSTGPSRLVVTSANAQTVLGADLEELATSWQASLAGDDDTAEAARAASTDELDVRTAEASRAQMERSAAGGFTAFGPIVGAFILIALLTSVLVVANTLSVTIAQRTRDLALLRTLGATRRQVTAVVARESLLVALIGSVLGTAVGHAVVQGVLTLAPHLEWTPRASAAPVSVLSVVLPLATGLAVVMCAGLGPLQRATRVAPLEALRVTPPRRAGTGTVRIVLTTLCLLSGGALMAAGVEISRRGSAGPAIALGVAGGALALFGALLAMRVIVVPAVRLIGVVIGVLGVPARVAVANVRRHPGRSASTAAALLIGTTLMSMLAVGAQTADSSLASSLADRAPVDAVIRAPELPQEAVAEVAAIQGVDAAEPVKAGEIQIGDEEGLTVYGPERDQLDRTAVRDDLGASVGDGELVLGSDRAQSIGLHEGQSIDVPRAAGGTEVLTVRVDGNLKLTLVSAGTFEHLFGEIPPSAVFVAFAAPGSAARAGTDVFTIVGDLNGMTSTALPGARMDSEGATREVAQQVITLMLGITAGLLAVAVVVSLVGVANTLSLGVVERTGENALLRALGATRRQMQTMLAWEGLLLSVVGALAGVVVGSVCGVLGAMVVLSSRFPVIISIPWEQLGAVLVLTILAGVLASVLPGRSAARTAPARAVADAL